MRILVAFFLFLTCSVVAAQGKQVATVAEMRKITDGVLASIGAANYDSAWKQLKPYSMVPSAEFDAFVANFQTQIPAISQRYGKAIASEFVREEKAGESLTRLTYLAKHEKSAMRWWFVLYRGDKGWTISDFKFDGNINAVFASPN